MKIAAPAVINDVVWSYCAASAFAAIFGRIGDDMVAANAVAVMVVNIGAIACRGFANATTVSQSARSWVKTALIQPENMGSACLE